MGIAFVRYVVQRPRPSITNQGTLSSASSASLKRPPPGHQSSKSAGRRLPTGRQNSRVFLNGGGTIKFAPEAETDNSRFNSCIFRAASSLREQAVLKSSTWPGCVIRLQKLPNTCERRVARHLQIFSGGVFAIGRMLQKSTGRQGTGRNLAPTSCHFDECQSMRLRSIERRSMSELLANEVFSETTVGSEVWIDAERRQNSRDRSR